MHKDYDIYICYAHQDRVIASMFNAKLQHYGLSVFYDVDSFSMAGNYSSFITNAISRCSLFLYLHSENSSQSNWVRKEVEFAIIKGVKIVPVNIDFEWTDNCRIRSLLHDRQWLEFDTNSYEYKQNSEKIIKEILIVGGFYSKFDRQCAQRESQIECNHSESLPYHSEEIDDSSSKLSVKSTKETYDKIPLWLIILSSIFIFLGYVGCGLGNYEEGIPIIILGVIFGGIYIGL